MTTKGSKLPLNSVRTNEQFGPYHGVGIPAQAGKKDGGFTDNMYSKNRQSSPKDKPPRKFN